MTLNLIKKLTLPYSKTLPGYQEVSDPVYYDPANKVFSVGEYAEFEPMSDNWYWNLNEWKQRQLAIKSAGVDNDEIGTSLAGVNPQLYGKAHEVLETVDVALRNNSRDYTKFIKSGAILKREDFSAFKTIVAQTKILAVKPRKHILLDLINIDNVSDFQTKLYSFDGPWDMVQENLPEMNVPFITGYPSFTPQTIPMERYGMHYAFSEEFVSEQFDFDIKKFVVDNVAGQLELVFSKKVADVLNNSSTFSAYGDWTAKTANISNRNPAEDINAEATKIDNTLKNEGLTLGSNRKVYNAYLNNYFSSGYGTPQYKQPGYSFGNAVVTNIPQFVGLDWGIDSFFNDNKFVAFDPAAIYAARMPQRIVDYKSQYQTHIGTIIRQNFICRAIDTTRLLGGSAVTT